MQEMFIGTPPNKVVEWIKNNFQRESTIDINYFGDYGDYGSGITFNGSVFKSGKNSEQVKWGDGTIDNLNSSTIRKIHAYSNSGNKHIQFQNNLSQIKMAGEASVISKNIVMKDVQKYDLFGKYYYDETIISLFQNDLNLGEIEECVLPNLEHVSSYAFGNMYPVVLEMPKVDMIEQISFYSNGLRRCKKIIIDNIQTIERNCFIHDDYGCALNLEEVYIRAKTCQEIKNMQYFPWIEASHPKYNIIRFYGSDGYVKANGTIVYNS